MTLNQMGRRTMASVVSLAMGLGLTACSRDYTLAYLYTTSATQSTTGVINAYAVDYQSGALVQLADSPVSSGYKNPVTLVTTPDGKFLYVVHRDDSNVAEFAIGTDGKLYAQHTYNVIGSFPMAAAIDPAGKFLYVTSTYQPGFTTALTGPGNVTIFPINADNSLGTPTSVNVGNSPIGIVASNFNHFVYVLDRESIAKVAAGVVLAFSQNTTTGALTPVTVGTNALGGYRIGVAPSAIAEDPTARFLYVTDQSTNQLYGSLVQASGSLVQMTNSPFTTGLYPVAVTIDPRGKYLYVANFNANTIGAYAIDPATGTPANSVGGTTNVGTGPTCITIDNALGKYMYTSNNLDGTVSGLQLNANTGGLTQIQNTPFPASALPTCAVAVATGTHPTQVVVP